MKTNRAAFISGEFTRLPGDKLIPGGCTYYRAYLPMNMIGAESYMGLPAWNSQHGFGVRAGKEAVFGFDVVFLKQMMERWLPHQMEIAKGLGQKLVVDVDDFYHSLHEDNHAYKATDPAINKVRNRDIYEKVIAAADLVTVSTPLLADFYRQFNPNIHVVRNVVYPQQFQRRPVSKDKPVLGWVGALGFRSGDVETLTWLGDFLEDHDLMFHHSGWQPQHGRDFAERAGINPKRLTTSPMRPFTHYHDMFSFDIGLVPLNRIPFNEAKSYLKGLEYSSSGIPFVAEGLPEYKRLADAGVGRTADTPEEWAQHVTALLNHKIRKQDAGVNYAITTKKFSLESGEPEWKRIYSLLVES